jgi:hypothetical protein
MGPRGFPGGARTGRDVEIGASRISVYSKFVLPRLIDFLIRDEETAKPGDGGAEWLDGGLTSPRHHDTTACLLNLVRGSPLLRFRIDLKLG